MKELRFIGTSLDDLSRFPTEVKRAAGFELWQVQNGLAPSDWKPMNNVGVGVREIRIHVGGAWRVLYVAKLRKRFMCCTPFGRKRNRRHDPILSWEQGDTERLRRNEIQVH